MRTGRYDGVERDYYFPRIARSRRSPGGFFI
jgi:hypothetical protein